MNELQKIVKEIQYRSKHDLTIDDIARRLGYARPYLNDQINKGDNQTIKQKLLKTYQKELEHFVRNDSANELNEPSEPYENDGKLSMKAIVNLTESNRLMAESQLSLARSHEELVAMVKRSFSQTSKSKFQKEPGVVNEDKLQSHKKEH